MEIKGKSILITGGLGGFGAYLAERLTAAGAEVFIFDRLPSDQPRTFQVNAADEDEVAAALEQIDRVDVLINCAGEIYSEPLINFIKKDRHRLASWNRVIGSNLNSCFNMSVQAAQKMAAARVRGLIINFSSISARGNPGQAAYSAAKAGVEALTRVLARELGMFKIRAVAVAPGFIDTPSTRASLGDKLVDYWVGRTPLRQLGRLEDIWKTVEYAIECDHLSGAVIAVDGALSI